MLTDAHIHLFDLNEVSRGLSGLPPGVMACASAHSRPEFAWQEERAREAAGRIVLSFGIHPQNPVPDEISFLESLVRDGRIEAIGECGFDLFTADFTQLVDDQKKVWDAQISIAEQSHLPVIVHCRKALQFVFADTSRLRRLKAVVFHGWPGSAREATSMLDRGVNAFFCAGKSLLKGDRSLVDTIRALSPNRILTETDAPYMKSRGEDWNDPRSIGEITARAADIAGVERDAFETVVESSFRTVFGIQS